MSAGAKPLASRSAIARARELWCRGEVFISPHALERMRERCVTAVELEHVILRSGRIVESSHPGRAWRYVIEGRTTEARDIRCVVELEERLVVVTVVAMRS